MLLRVSNGAVIVLGIIFVVEIAQKQAIWLVS